MGLDIGIVKTKKQKESRYDYWEFQDIKQERVIYWRKNYLVLDFIQKKLGKALDQCEPERLTKTDIKKIINHCKKTLKESKDEWDLYGAKTGLEELNKLKDFDYENDDLFIDWVS